MAKKKRLKFFKIFIGGLIGLFLIFFSFQTFARQINNKITFNDVKLTWQRGSSTHEFFRVGDMTGPNPFFKHTDVFSFNIGWASSEPLSTGEFFTFNVPRAFSHAPSGGFDIIGPGNTVLGKVTFSPTADINTSLATATFNQNVEGLPNPSGVITINTIFNPITPLGGESIHWKFTLGGTTHEYRGLFEPLMPPIQIPQPESESYAPEPMPEPDVHEPDPLPVGTITIRKNLAGFFADWGVTTSKVFQARVRDVSNGCYLRFNRQANGTFQTDLHYCGSAPTSDTRELVEFSVANSALLTNIWAGSRYVVEEIGGHNYTATSSGNNAVVSLGGNMIVTITNTYERGTGNLVITKNLAGSFADWGVSKSTVFRARVKDVTNNNYVYFFQQADGTYRADGNSGSDVPGTNPNELIIFSADRPAILTNLWSDTIYIVEEVQGSFFETSYIGNSRSFPESGNMIVTVTNTYEHGLGKLVITKTLVGKFASRNVNESTIFRARVKDVTNDNYLIFKTTPEADGTIRCVGNDVDGLSENFTGPTTEFVEFTAHDSVIISNLWANIIYKVEEVEGHYFQASYRGNSNSFGEGENIVVNITNLFRTDDELRGDDSLKNPSTGSARLPFIILTLSMITAIGVIYITSRKNKFYKI